MSLEPGQPSSGEQPAFTGRFPVPRAETPAGQGSGGSRPTFSAPASGPAESLAPASATGGGQHGNPPRPGDGAAEPGPGSSESGTAEGAAAGTGPSGDPSDTPASPSDPDATAALRPAVKPGPSAATGTDSGTGPPDISGSGDVSAGAAAGSARDGSGGAVLPAASVEGADGPLLADTVALRSNWERVQAGFVDDPGEAVADAAELVERTVQALIGALRQRQRTLRELAKRGPADGQAPVGAGPADGTPMAGKGTGPSGALDTEHLRRMMLRYRALFNQVCRP